MMKCSRCGREITEDETYSYQNQALCEDCLMEIGLHPKECEPWATYTATHTRERQGQRGEEGLTDLQKKLYEFIKSNGKVIREELRANFNLSEAEMDAQVAPLMHSEMVKVHDEGDHRYLIPIG